MGPKLRSAQLPSGQVVRFEAIREPAGRRPRDGAPLFSEVGDLLSSGDVRVLAGDRALSLDALELRDFHALRALLTATGWLHEESLEIRCRNCDAPIELRPCEAMPLGPFVDRELGDADLDTTCEIDEDHLLPAAGSLRLGRLTAADARPLHEALAAGPLRLSATLVRAMGIRSLDGEVDAAKIAGALDAMSDDAFGEVTDLFLAAHYPPRLAGIMACPECAARNDVDAPYEREFEPSAPRAERSGRFASREVFERAANEQARRIFDQAGLDLERCATADDLRQRLVFVIDSGTPACDDGGEPLLGSYVPAFAGDMTVPMRPAEITVFYRTFRAMWEEDGEYDWEAELGETIEHELEHHFAYLAGDDPVDEAEREEIASETERVLGKREVARQGIRQLGADIAGFARKTWPIWLLLLAAVVLTTLVGER